MKKIATVARPPGLVGPAVQYDAHFAPGQGATVGACEGLSL